VSGPTARPGGTGGNGSTPGAGNGSRPPGAAAGGFARPGAGGAPPGPFGRGGGGRGPGMMGMLSMPAAKALDFRASFRRLMGRLAPERALVGLVVVFAVVSVAFAVIGPKILGNAINDIFNGVISQNLPAGVTKDQIVAGLRARGENQFADMVAAMDLHPGQGIDFGSVSTTGSRGRGSGDIRSTPRHHGSTRSR